MVCTSPMLAANPHRVLTLALGTGTRFREVMIRPEVHASLIPEEKLEQLKQKSYRFK